MDENSDKTNIRVNKTTRDAIEKSKINERESYNEVIERILAKYREKTEVTNDK